MDLQSQPGPGFKIGGYRITGRLGHGAMAEVYDAIDPTGHAVALKVFRAGGGVSPTMLERFRREAEAAKKLRRHPNVLTVYSTGLEGDYHFIAMERIEDSRTLETLISGGASVSDLLQVTIKVASALHYAHEQQIIHRDVKPSNIMLGDFNEPLLADFGVAELTDWPSVTLSGALTGTPIYMSPEQARSDRVTAAADVYSLGVVLFEALTGELPYELPEAPSTAIILEAVKHRPPLRPRKLTKRVSKDLEYVLLKSLRKKPDDRYATAREFAYDLEAVLEGRPVTARWASPWAASSRWFRRNRTLLFGLLAVGIAMAVVIEEVARRFRDARHRNLVVLAVSASRAQKLASMTDSRRTEPEMRSAHKAMLAGRWLEARDLLHTATQINRELSQEGALAEALLGWARCETMLHNSLRAREVYAELLAMPDVSKGIREHAAFELGLLLLLENRQAEVEGVLAVVDQDEDSAVIDCLRVALGQTPHRWKKRRSEWSGGLRVNAMIAEAIGLRGSESMDEVKLALDQWKKEADLPPDWPTPLIDYLRGRL